MNEKVVRVLFFGMGTLTGVALTLILAKRKSRDLEFEEEISFGDILDCRDQMPKTDEPLSESPILSTKEEPIDYSAIIKQHYTKTNTTDNHDSQKPYPISPDEYGEMEDYEPLNLYLYTDHVLTDTEFEIITDIEGTIGCDAIDKLDEYEENAIYIRNPVIKCDYEILLNNEDYMDAMNEEPY